MRKIRKRKTNRNLIYGIVFSAMLFLTVGYSVLTTSLNFNITTHKNRIPFEVGEQVQVLGLTPTFHVVEVHDEYLELLSDKAEGYALYSNSGSRFEDSQVYKDLTNYTRYWKTYIESAGGTTYYYNVSLISRDVLRNLILSRDPTANVDGSWSLDFESIGLGWSSDYEYKYEVESTNRIYGFYTSTLNLSGGNSIYNINFLRTPSGEIMGMMSSLSVGSYGYGMDIRPYLRIDIDSVKKM